MIFSFIDEYFDVLLDGKTRCKGNWVDNTASIAFPLKQKNVFIIGCVDPINVKMVKIKVTGEKTFDWIEAKYQKNYPKECSTEQTFLESCFEGPSVTQDNYDVVLAAVPRTMGTYILTVNIQINGLST